jgi:predicted TIM-barrel fold metal-dependent hydrolase
MFSVDWPFVSNKAGVDWLQNNYLNTADKEKIFSGNARNLLRI